MNMITKVPADGEARAVGITKPDIGEAACENGSGADRAV